MSEWNEMRIKDFANVVAGGTPNTSNDEYWNGNIGWITPADLSNYKFRYISNGERNITELGLQKSSACLLPKNTVLLSSRAPIGYVAIAETELATNQGFKNLVCDENKADYRFVYYWLSANTEVLKSFASGATFPEISASNVKRIKAILPNLPAQKRIADILSAYDDLIENNNRRIAILEKAAQELYKEWFVRFRFPGYETAKFENGLPEGWVYGRLSSIMSFGAGKERPSSGGIYPVYGGNGILDYCDSYNNENAIIIGRVGAYCGSVYYEPEKCWISDNALYAISKNNAIYFNYYMLKHLNLNARQVGTGQPLITQGLLNKIKTIIPSNPLIHKYNSLVSDLLLQQRYLKQKNESLTKQRDLLLPRFMSGKLEV